MHSSAEELSAAITAAAVGELDNGFKKITHCLKQLSQEQVWWRPAPSMNSIANLMLHVSGNIRQWIISGVGGATDTRNRPQEFSERTPVDKDRLLLQLEATIDEAQRTLAVASIDQLIDNRRIQGFQVTGIAAVVHSVSHFQGHVQEIVHLTRTQLGEGYAFEFVPQTPEQGAPDC